MGNVTTYQKDLIKNNVLIKQAKDLIQDISRLVEGRKKLVDVALNGEKNKSEFVVSPITEELFEVIQKKNVELSEVSTLLDRGADANAAMDNDDEECLVDYAFRMGLYDIVVELLKYGAKPSRSVMKRCMYARIYRRVKISFNKEIIRLSAGSVESLSYQELDKMLTACCRVKPPDWVEEVHVYRFVNSRIEMFLIMLETYRDSLMELN